MTVNVLVVDEYELVRLGLRNAFEQAGGLHVVAQAANLHEASAMTRLHEPDVVVVDMHLGKGQGLDLVRQLRASRPDTGVVAMTMHEGDEHLFSALEAGASAYVWKWAPCQELVTSVRAACTAPGAFSAGDLVGAMRRRQTPAVRLTSREHGILVLLTEGLSVAQISGRLFISQSTTKTHMAKVYEKLGAANRTQAAMAAVRLGLVDSHAAAS